MNYYQTLKTLAVAIFMGCSVLSTQAQIYVDASATGDKDGSSWANAFNDLQAALDVAAENAEIRVASGTYKPTAAPDDSTNDNRNKAFHFNKNLVLKGSYNTTTNAQVFANPSILSGDFNDDDVITGSGSTLSITNNTENAYHVMITEGLTTATQIEGFLITGGHANDFVLVSYSGETFYHDSGAGMYNDTSSPSIVNTVFSGNTAYNGAGMYNETSSPSIVNTVFSGNHAQLGGGVYNNNGSHPNIVNSTFSGNLATNTGGGIRNNHTSSPTIYNSVFYGNGSDIANTNTSGSVTATNNFSEDYEETGFTLLTEDPFYRSSDPIGTDGVWFTDDDGLKPKIGSPIIDAGDATKLPLDTADLDGDGDTTKVIPFDIRGRSRALGTSVDVGAYEYDSTVLSVKEIDSSSLDIYSSGNKTLVIHGVLNAKTTANVYSLRGKLVASKVFNKFSTSNTLDVSTLSTGIYIVKMYNAKHQVHTKKLFIQ